MVKSQERNLSNVWQLSTEKRHLIPSIEIQQIIRVLNKIGMKKLMKAIANIDCISRHKNVVRAHSVFLLWAFLFYS